MVAVTIDRTVLTLILAAPVLLGIGWLLGPGWRWVAGRVDAQVCRVGNVEWGEAS